MSILTQAAIQEVYDCHGLIQEWFNGTEKAIPQLLKKLLAKFAGNFSMINPAGKALSLRDLETLLSSMRGARPDVKIDVTQPQTIFTCDSCCILKYEEFQYMESEHLHRNSTAIFISDGSGGVLWQHLHETWISWEQNK